MYDPPYALWSLWPQLSWLYRGMTAILAAVFIYTLFSGIRSMQALRSIWRRGDANAHTIRASMTAARISLANGRLMTEAAFYLFGFVFFLGLQTVGNWIGDGKVSPDVLFMRNFILHAAFAANIFFAFLVLHFVQWGFSAALNSLSKRLNEHPE